MNSVETTIGKIQNEDPEKVLVYTWSTLISGSPGSCHARDKFGQFLPSLGQSHRYRQVDISSAFWYIFTSLRAEDALMSFMIDFFLIYTELKLASMIRSLYIPDRNSSGPIGLQVLGCGNRPVGVNSTSSFTMYFAMFCATLKTQGNSHVCLSYVPGWHASSWWFLSGSLWMCKDLL